MLAQEAARPEVLNRRLKLHAVCRLKSILVVGLLVIAEDIGEAVMLALLNVIQFLRMIGHRAVLGIDKPALVIPIKTKRIAIASRIDLRHLLTFRRVKPEDAGGEVTPRQTWACRAHGGRQPAQPAGGGLGT